MVITDNWDQHWNEYNQCARDNPALAYRRRLIFSLLGVKGAGDGIRLLDIGSGQGDFAAAVRKRWPKAGIVGLELSQSGVEISRAKVPDALFLQKNLLEDNSPPEDLRHWATHAVCSEVIEHVDDPCRLLRNARNYMSGGCIVVVTAPGGPMSAFDRHIGHRKHYNPAEIAALFRNAGYETESLARAGFPFFNFYRYLVVARGEKIIDDAKSRKDHSASLPARLAMAVFQPLFSLNIDSSPWGWQMTGRARVSKLEAEFADSSSAPAHSREHEA